MSVSISFSCPHIPTFQDKQQLLVLSLDWTTVEGLLDNLQEQNPNGFNLDKTL